MLKKLTKLITNNFGLKILAIIFSCALWLVVVSIDDPKTTRTFTTTVSIEHENYLNGIGKYYEIVNNSNTVSFKVTGKRSYLERMSNSDFKAVADLETIENMERVPIEITPQRYAGNVSIVNKNYYLELTVEDLMSAPFVISVKAEGNVSDQNALGSLSASPTILRVSGPASVVETIDKVVAIVNVEGMSEDMTDSVIPILYDAEGNQVDTSELSFNVQSILVSAQILNTKEVTLNFQTTGTLPDKYEYVGIEYQPQTVMIKGEASILNTINSITIPKEVLDLTDATGDIETNVDVSSYLPEGVSLVDSSQAKIDVIVKIEKHETRTFYVPTANITASNLPGRYDVKFLEDNVEVQIEGLTSDLDNLDASTLTGSIDAGGMTNGEHTLNLTLNLDERYKMKTAATVTVDIVKAESAAINNSENNKEPVKDQTNKEEQPDSEKDSEQSNTDDDAAKAKKTESSSKKTED